MSQLSTSLQQPDEENYSSSRPQTLSHQLHGVATSSSDVSPPPSPSSALSGVQNDLAEFGGSLKTTGLSLLSAAGISKFAANLLPASEHEPPPGITDDTLAFVTELSKLPDCWTDFLAPLDHQGFSMSDAQREHACAVVELVPEFAELRDDVCGSLSEEQFWMIYFLLLLPRLNAEDFELLSTPELVEAREALSHKVRKNRQISEGLTLDSTEKDTEVEKAQGMGFSSLAKKNLTEIVNTVESLRIDDEESTEKWSEEASISFGTSVVEKAQGVGFSSSAKKDLTEIVNTVERLRIGDEASTEQKLEEASISSGTVVDGPKKLEHEDIISFSDQDDDPSDISSRSSGRRSAPIIWEECSSSDTDEWVRV